MSDDSVPPLAGLRILEAGSLVAGPFSGQLLGDLGAEIIKIEAPGVGDAARPWYGGLWWPILSRNKKSVEVDLRCAEGQEVFRRLAAMSDIVIENFRPGTMESWHLDYDALSARNPRLIMLRTSGYGQTGPYSKRAGYASAGEAMGGLRYVGGFPDRPPPRMGISIGDTLAGLFATVGALAALRERDRSGRGQVIDTAIYESVLACMESLVPEYAIGGTIRQRSGTGLNGIAPSNVYPTQDGEMIIAANQDTLFVRLCRAMGRPELATDERFRSHTARGENQDLLDSLIADWTRTLTNAELVAVLDEHQVAFGPINRAPEMLADPHFIARESIVRIVHKLHGEFPMQNVFPRLTRTPGRIKWAGPDLGEHNEEILAGVLSLTPDEILRAQGRRT